MIWLWPWIEAFLACVGGVALLACGTLLLFCWLDRRGAAAERD